MQTKRESFIETLSNVATGFITTMVLSPPIYWLAGVELKYTQMGLITLMFTITSVIRGYVIRRWFNTKEKVVICSVEHNMTQEEVDKFIFDLRVDDDLDFTVPIKEKDDK